MNINSLASILSEQFGSIQNVNHENRSNQMKSYSRLFNSNYGLRLKAFSISPSGRTYKSLSLLKLLLLTLTILGCSSNIPTISGLFGLDTAKGGLAIYFQQGNELIKYNSSSDEYTSLFSDFHTILKPIQFAPDSSKIAMTVYCNDDSARLIMLDLFSDEVEVLAIVCTNGKNINAPNHFTFSWSPDGDKLCLGTYRFQKNSQNIWSTSPNIGEISIVDLSTKEISSVGCTQSKIVNFWSPTNGIFVENNKSWYFVDEDNCSVKIKVPDNEELWAPKYSLAADSYLYFLPKELYLTNQGYRKIKVWELYLLDKYGNKKIVCPSVARPNPSSTVWSADGTKFTFESNLKGWENVITTNIYVLESEELSSLYEKSYLGPLDCTNAQLSPKGDRISYNTSTQITTSSVNILDLDNNYKATIREPGKALWIDNVTLMVVDDRRREGTEMFHLKMFDVSSPSKVSDVEISNSLFEFTHPGRLLYTKRISS